MIVFCGLLLILNSKEMKTEKERFTARMDILVTPSMKEKLIEKAKKDRRELSDYLRLHFEKLIK